MTVFKTPILPSGVTEVRIYYDCSVGVSLFWSLWSTMTIMLHTTRLPQTTHHVNPCHRVLTNLAKWNSQNFPDPLNSLFHYNYLV